MLDGQALLVGARVLGDVVGDGGVQGRVLDALGRGVGLASLEHHEEVRLEEREGAEQAGDAHVQVREEVQLALGALTEGALCVEEQHGEEGDLQGQLGLEVTVGVAVHWRGCSAGARSAPGCDRGDGAASGVYEHAPLQP